MWLAETQGVRSRSFENERSIKTEQEKAYKNYVEHLRVNYSLADRIVKQRYQEPGCCFNKISLTVCIYLILAIFIMVTLLNATRIFHEGPGHFLYLEHYI